MNAPSKTFPSCSHIYPIILKQFWKSSFMSLTVISQMPHLNHFKTFTFYCYYDFGEEPDVLNKATKDMQQGFMRLPFCWIHSVAVFMLFFIETRKREFQNGFRKWQEQWDKYTQSEWKHYKGMNSNMFLNVIDLLNQNSHRIFQSPPPIISSVIVHCQTHGSGGGVETVQL